MLGVPARHRFARQYAGEDTHGVRGMPRVAPMEESQMNARIAQIVVSSALVLALAGCGGLTTREQDTVVGAGLGAAAGAAITGDVGGAVGGGVIGGVIGNQIGRDREERRHGPRY